MVPDPADFQFWHANPALAGGGRAACPTHPTATISAARLARARADARRRAGANGGAAFDQLLFLLGTLVAGASLSALVTILSFLKLYPLPFE